ncbi:MAG TPA: aminoglycoside phosphotransferase family protein [Gammaproteobacteria bacterium]|nr:aminoglycoside phosphotransferase family protein [Gammaproteobacteria bacterium]
MNTNQMIIINEKLVHTLVVRQFPQWKDLPIRPVSRGGWDNKTFHLGENMLVRMPIAAEYALQVEKEHQWLPKLRPFLPLQIPVPLAMGKPTENYPWKWSIYRWLPGNNAASSPITHLRDFAIHLAQFLIALQHIDPTDGPLPGPHSFYRGGNLSTYDNQVRQAIILLKNKINIVAATKVWERALTSTWQGSPVWVHGDISPGNLLMQNGHLSAVIDFGQLVVGDPACDLSITWMLFNGESREIFRSMLPLDADTWARARGWTLWKFLIVAAGLTSWDAFNIAQAQRIIDEVINDI